MSKRTLILGAALVAVGALLPAGVANDVEAKPCNPGHPCPSPSPSPSPSPTVSPSPPPSGDPVITAAGDIADPVPTAATKATAQLIASINPTVALTLGDNQYEGGALSDFQKGYGPTWGAFLSKTRPAIGNHEYKSSSTAAGYFGYFGSRSPDNYYSFTVGAWHVISLDSNCAMAGGCTSGTPQYEWLKADLSSHPARCTLAYWHHPRWSSGIAHGNSAQVAPFMTLLYNAGADVVLSGHEHNYERYAPQTPGGNVDTARGIVEFVAGTGGHGLYPLGPPDTNSRVRNDSTFGVLRMTLHPSSYDFSFRPVLGGTFTDSGSAACH
jgi:calcineurin-like phosphoesterase family protein